MTTHRTSYTVSYNSESHWSVITQMWGSQWPKVLPYCIFNVCLMVTLIILDRHTGAKLNIEISSQGHSFLTMIVAFLLISRVNTGLGRYNMARDYLGSMYREAREVIQLSTVFSNTVTDQAAKEWRHEVAYRCLILLRSVMAVIDYPIDTMAPWDLPELNGVEEKDIKQSSFLNAENRRWAHGERTVWEEAMRVPVRLAYLLRTSLHSQASRLKEPIAVPQENKLLGSVDAFMGGYYGIRKFLTTPVPFPLIQMARTFLFLYVFTVPFVLLSDSSSDFAHVFSVFLLTYGFVGLEIVAIELDNPFGDDENDFNNSALAMTAYEDTYLTILDLDGPEWTDKLRARMFDGGAELPSEQTWLLSAV